MALTPAQDAQKQENYEMEKDLDNTPLEKEWGKISDSDMDLKYVYKKFFGKTNLEMQRIYSGVVAIEYIDALRWMPSVPFYYYVQGVINHIINRHYKGIDAYDAAHSFFVLVKEKLEKNPGFFMPIKDKVLTAVNFIMNNQSAFCIDRYKSQDKFASLYSYIHENLEKI